MVRSHNYCVLYCTVYRCLTSMCYRRNFTTSGRHSQTKFLLILINLTKLKNQALYFSSSPLLFVLCLILTSPSSQAAADYVKAHLPESLKQQLQAFEREKRESALSYASILEQRILAVDREMLDKLSANHDEAGQGRGGEYALSPKSIQTVGVFVHHCFYCVDLTLNDAFKCNVHSILSFIYTVMQNTNKQISQCTVLSAYIYLFDGLLKY